MEQPVISNLYPISAPGRQRSPIGVRSSLAILSDSYRYHSGHWRGHQLLSPYRAGAGWCSVSVFPFTLCIPSPYCGCWWTGVMEVEWIEYTDTLTGSALLLVLRLSYWTDTWLDSCPAPATIEILFGSDRIQSLTNQFSSAQLAP